MQMSREFLELLDSLIARQKYVAIQYFSEFHEFLTTHALIRQQMEKCGQTWVLLSTGEEVPVSQLISLNGHYAPQHGFDDLSCECD